MTKIDTLLITGSTRGLGRSLALNFSKAGYFVYAVGRDANSLNELAQTSPLIQPIIANISTEEGREIIIKNMDKHKSISVIHNAAIADPSPFDVLPERLLREHFETNFFSPILISQQLLPQITKGQRILHVTSGAANLALSSLMPYCATKAALEHATHCLNMELNSRGIYCASLRPGMIDTEMQLKFRNSEKNILPNRDFYIDAEKENLLIKPEIVAEFVAWVILKTEDTEFSRTSWNIYDAKHHPAWLFSNGYSSLLGND